MLSLNHCRKITLQFHMSALNCHLMACFCECCKVQTLEQRKGLLHSICAQPWTQKGSYTPYIELELECIDKH